MTANLCVCLVTSFSSCVTLPGTACMASTWNTCGHSLLQPSNHHRWTLHFMAIQSLCLNTPYLDIPTTSFEHSLLQPSIYFVWTLTRMTTQPYHTNTPCYDHLNTVWMFPVTIIQLLHVKTPYYDHPYNLCEHSLTQPTLPCYDHPITSYRHSLLWPSNHFIRTPLLWPSNDFIWTLPVMTIQSLHMDTP